MSWFSKWFSTPNKKRGQDEDIQKPQGKRAKVLFPQSASTPGKFLDDRYLTFGAEDADPLGPLLASALVPRPCAVVVGLNTSRELCLATSSYCTVVSASPPYVCVGLSSKDGFPEESAMPAGAITKSRELTVNLVSEWLADAAYASTGAYALPEDTAEADLKTGLTTSDSEEVSVPRISEAAVSLECKLRYSHRITDEEGQVASTVLIAEVLRIAAKEGVVTENGDGQKIVDVKQLKPVAILGDEVCARVSGFYSLANTGPLAPDTPDGGAAGAEGGEPQAEVVEAVAAAVAEALDGEPGAQTVAAVEVTLAAEETELIGDVPVTVTQEA